jgi:S-adenosyl-L-methionine hydrolase (adenosine-forming)
MHESAMGDQRSLITLLTDFGTQDYFVGAMKGVILSLNPAAQIVDITHDIPPQDIEAGAFNLLACYRDFPARTVHVAVVDPGVGSERRALALACANQILVGPDNGLFSWICEREPDYRAFSITNPKFFSEPVSATFHGRDVFAPVAAALSTGRPIEQVGERLTDIVRLPSLTPKTLGSRTVEGRVIHIDHFGNVITNLTPDHLRFERGARIVINGHEIDSFRRYFADASHDGDLFCFFGSAGFLEIAAKNSSARDVLKVGRGQELKFMAPSAN